jgi:prolyl-tRNA editing enzyme YbaK/EbsC (Cys-tRNA(Pro) deacylase)
MLVNGGKRGFLIEVDPHDLHKAFEIIPIDVAVKV